MSENQAGTWMSPSAVPLTMRRTRRQSLNGDFPFLYRVTIQLVQTLPLISKPKFRFGLASPGQSGTYVLKTPGGFAQAEWSPCTSSYLQRGKLRQLQVLLQQGERRNDGVRRLQN